MITVQCAVCGLTRTLTDCSPMAWFRWHYSQVHPGRRLTSNAFEVEQSNWTQEVAR